MKVSLFEDKIAFRFEEEITNHGFINKTESGSYIQEVHSEQIKRPRWGVVLQTGPDCTEVSEGDVILIENSMWTNGIDFEETESSQFWVTRERNVIAVRDRNPINTKQNITV